MKTNIAGGIFHLTKCVLFLLIILALSCTSTSYMRLEGDDFNKNLPGQWEGKWYWRSGSSSDSGKKGIKIIKIYGNKVHLTGYSETSGLFTNEIDVINGRIENSTLLLTWPSSGGGVCEDILVMKRDDSNSLVLEGPSECPKYTLKVQYKKIE